MKSPTYKNQVSPHFYHPTSLNPIPIPTNPSNQFLFVAELEVGWELEELVGGGGTGRPPPESLKSLQNIHMGPPLFNLLLTFSCSHHLLQLTTKLSLCPYCLHSFILVTLILLCYSSFFHLLVNLLSFSSVTGQQVQIHGTKLRGVNLYAKQMLLRQWTRTSGLNTLLSFDTTCTPQKNEKKI